MSLAIGNCCLCRKVASLSDPPVACFPMADDKWGLVHGECLTKTICGRCGSPLDITNFEYADEADEDTFEHAHCQRSLKPRAKLVRF
jgi:hypothetical protein